jgi:hypothetical protein
LDILAGRIHQLGFQAQAVEQRMRRYVILAATALALLLLLFLALPRRDGNAITTETPQPAQATASANPSSHASNPVPEQQAPSLMPDAAGTNQEGPLLQLIRKGNEAANLPVAFYGLVVDQDSNALQNVSVDLAVEAVIVDSLSESKRTQLHKQTGADGRFDVGGLQGRFVCVTTLEKDGYDTESPGSFGTYPVQSGSFTDPVVFQMWRTNMHESLITGDKSFDLVPDGRHYAIDLLKGTIADGEDGDLVVWMKRPQSITWGQRYGWTYELTVRAGGLQESQTRDMFRAPEAGYTNVFDHEEKPDVVGSTAGFQNKGFYVLLRKGQMYGRLVISLFPGSSNDKSGLIQLSYAVNPSGSRLLR